MNIKMSYLYPVFEKIKISNHCNVVLGAVGNNLDIGHIAELPAPALMLWCSYNVKKKLEYNLNHLMVIFIMKGLI